MKKRKHILGLLLIVAMLLSLLPYQRAEAAAKKYLVISYDDGNYWGYHDMVERTSDGALMIPAKKFADNFWLEYKNLGNGNFTLTDKETGATCTYQRGAKEYSYTKYFFASLSKRQNNTAKYAPMLSNKTNMIHCSAVSPLFYCKYFSASTATEYKAKGYSGVLLYSKYPLSDSDLPPISYIENAEELGLIEKEDIKDPSENDTDDKKEPTLGEIIDSNLDALKTYIMTYGGTNKNGDKIINYYYRDVLPDGDVSESACAIALNESNGEMTFIYRNTLDNVESAITFILNPTNSATKTTVNCVLADMEYGLGFSANSQMYIASYNEEDLYFVKEQSIYMTDDTINKLANINLKLAINLLNIMLYDKIGLTLPDIGFLLYE